MNTDLINCSYFFRPSSTYKPFRYPWAYEFWQRQQQIHWLPEEIPLGEDCKDWAVRLTPEERNLLTQIFRFFTQSDVDVNNNYISNYLSVFQPVEVRMMMTAFANTETIHIAAYALLLETIGMPESEFSVFLEYSEMHDKHTYLHSFSFDNVHNILKTIAVFGAFVEGLQLFASFAMLMNFPRMNKMKGMGQVISWSIRDESLHCEGMVKVFKVLIQETKGMTRKLKEEIYEACKVIVELEDRFIDLAFEMGPVEGMSSSDIKSYIRFIADWRMSQLGFDPIYHVKTHPLPWLLEILNGVEFANFFETRATEYSKASSVGSWDGSDGVWKYFDEYVDKEYKKPQDSIF